MLWVVSPAFAQEVSTTNSIPRGPSECLLEQNRVAALDTSASVADIASLFGCTAKKLSTFELLGQKTEVFEFIDGQRRLQVTVRNNKVVSRTFRNL
jgi:hypothetical protein